MNVSKLNSTLNSRLVPTHVKTGEAGWSVVRAHQCSPSSMNFNIRLNEIYQHHHLAPRYQGWNPRTSIEHNLLWSRRRRI